MRSSSIIPFFSGLILFALLNSAESQSTVEEWTAVQASWSVPCAQPALHVVQFDANMLFDHIPGTISLEEILKPPELIGPQTAVWGPSSTGDFYYLFTAATQHLYSMPGCGGFLPQTP